MSDFQEVNPIFLKRGGTSRYLVKYIMKSGEKALYSRGTLAEICKELSENDEVVTYFDYVTKYVLWDDVLDWERDIKDYGKKKKAQGKHHYVAMAHVMKKMIRVIFCVLKSGNAYVEPSI